MAYVRLEKIKPSAHIESIVSDTDLENGVFVALGDLQPDGEARFATPSGDQTQELAFHASVPLTYDNLTDETDFVLKAGRVGRAYILEDGDIIAIQASAITGGEVAKNALVNPAPTGFEIVDSANAGKLHGKIIDVENDGIAGQMAVIKIIK